MHLRIPTTLVLFSALLLLQGCVYLRLLDVKSQLADFHNHIVTDLTPDGLLISFREPTLKASDLKRLGVVPLRTSETATGYSWEVEMRKRYPNDDENENGIYDLSTELDFENDRLTAVLIPMVYLSCFPEELFVGTLEAFGESRVMALKQAVDVQATDLGDWANNVTYRAITNTFGDPYEEEVQGERLLLTYSFEKKEPEDLPEERRSDNTYEVTYVLDQSGKRLYGARTDSVQVSYADY